MQKSKGRIKQKLLTILNAAGLPIKDTDDFWIQEGFYRSRYHDLARWGAKWTVGHSQIFNTCASWDTMTDCVQYGVLISDDGEYEVSANMTQHDKSSQQKILERKQREREKWAKREAEIRRERKDTRSDRFRVYRCSRCCCQFPWHKGQEIKCSQCKQADCLADVSDDILG